MSVIILLKDHLKMKVFGRLNRVEVNGAESLSEFISIDVPVVDKMLSSISPNPTTEQFILELNLNEDVDKFSFTLYDASGKHFVLNEHSGKSFEAGYHRIAFNINDIPKGIYNLSLDSPFAQANHRIVIAK